MFFLLQERLISALAVRLRFLIASFTLLEEGSCHAGLYQGPWISDWVCYFTVNSIGEQEYRIEKSLFDSLKGSMCC